jgi:hypothetical protein
VSVSISIVAVTLAGAAVVIAVDSVIRKDWRSFDVRLLEMLIIRMMMISLLMVALLLQFQKAEN